MVALYTSAWIEIAAETAAAENLLVALYTSAWIEIRFIKHDEMQEYVALYTSAWIEIVNSWICCNSASGRTLHECVDWNN